MRVLVTGAAGFIGSSVVDRLLSEGHRVVGFDNFDPYYDPAQKRRNLAAALRNTSFELIEGDVRSAEAVESSFEPAPDAVVHLAARAGVRASVEDPLSYITVNEVGGLNVLSACQRRGGIPIAFASTSSVYGSDSQVPHAETEPAVRPLSPYAASKRGAELMVHAFHHIHAQPAAVLRFFTVYGPRGRPDMAFHLFTKKLINGQSIRLHGEQTARDFTYVADTVDGVVRALNWLVEGRGYDTFNLGRSEPVRVRSMIERLAMALGVEARVELGELMPGESPETYAEVSKAEAAFGYRPAVSLDEGIRRWVQWTQQSDEAPPELRRR